MTFLRFKKSHEETFEAAQFKALLYLLVLRSIIEENVFVCKSKYENPDDYLFF